MNSIQNNQVLAILAHDSNDIVADDDQKGTYIAPFIHHDDPQIIVEIFYPAPKSFEEVLDRLEVAKTKGAHVGIKGGDIFEGASFYQRLKGFCSEVHRRCPGHPYVAEFHDRLRLQGGHVLIIMIPVYGYVNEVEMKAAYSKKYGITFMNMHGTAEKRVRAKYLHEDMCIDLGLGRL